MTGGKENLIMFNVIKPGLHRTTTHGFSNRKQRMYDFLRANPVGVLSTVDPNGEPHGVVIYFTINREFDVFFLTRNETKKYDNLKRNDHLMLTVFEPHNQTTVQIIGKAIEMTGSSEINGIAGGIFGISAKNNDAGLPPIAKLRAGSFVAFKIAPVQVRMAVYSRPDAGDYTDIFESIESFDLDE